MKGGFGHHSFLANDGIWAYPTNCPGQLEDKCRMNSTGLWNKQERRREWEKNIYIHARGQIVKYLQENTLPAANCFLQPSFSPTEIKGKIAEHTLRTSYKKTNVE